MFDKINLLYSYKKSFDLCTSAFSQYVVLDYLKNNRLEKIIDKKIVVYKKALKKSIKELTEDNNNQIVFISNIKGGIFYLVKFKNKVNTEHFESGSNYYINGNHANTARINICSQL